METQMQRHTFNTRIFSCLRSIKGVRDKLSEDENFSGDGSDVEGELILLRVETMQKLNRQLEAIEEMIRCIIFQEKTRLFCSQ